VIACSAISAHFLRPFVRKHKFINKATAYSENFEDQIMLREIIRKDDILPNV